MYFFINRFVFQYLKWGVFCIGFKRVQAEVKSAYQRISVEQKLEGQPNLSGEISFWNSVGRANWSDTLQSVKQKCQNLREISYKFLCCSSSLPIYITLTSTKFVAWIPILKSYIETKIPRAKTFSFSLPSPSQIAKSYERRLNPSHLLSAEYCKCCLEPWSNSINQRRLGCL